MPGFQPLPQEWKQIQKHRPCCMKYESIIWVWHECRHEYGVRLPDDKSIRKWYEKLRLGSLGDLMKMWIAFSANVAEAALVKQADC
jgi:hypothetical protein